MKDLLGGKGSNLAEMTQIGRDVQQGFTVTTEACLTYLDKGHMPKEVEEQMEEKMKALEEEMDQTFGDSEDPLLVSVRSGAAVSMPGMMDTVLNLGLNDESVKGLIKKTDERFAYDSYRRFVQMFGNVVVGLDGADFEEIIDDKKEEYGVELDTELSVQALKELVEELNLPLES